MAAVSSCQEAAGTSTGTSPAAAAAVVPELISRRCRQLLRAMPTPLLHDVAVMLESAMAPPTVAAAASEGGCGARPSTPNDGAGSAVAWQWARALLWYSSRVAKVCGPEGAQLAGLPAASSAVLPPSRHAWPQASGAGSTSDPSPREASHTGSKHDPEGGHRDGGADVVHAAQPLLAVLLPSCALRAPLSAKQALAVSYRCYKKMVLMDGVLLQGRKSSEVVA